MDRSSKIDLIHRSQAIRRKCLLTQKVMNSPIFFTKQAVDEFDGRILRVSKLSRLSR
jgi:hypothetical protein